MNIEGGEFREIKISSGPFLFRTNGGLTIQVDENDNASLYFLKNNSPLIEVKSPSQRQKYFLASGVVVGLIGVIGISWWWFNKNE